MSKVHSILEVERAVAGSTRTHSVEGVSVDLDAIWIQDTGSTNKTHLSDEQPPAIDNIPHGKALRYRHKRARTKKIYHQAALALTVLETRACFCHRANTNYQLAHGQYLCFGDVKTRFMLVGFEEEKDKGQGQVDLADCATLAMVRENYTPTVTHTHVQKHTLTHECVHPPTPICSLE